MKVMISPSRKLAKFYKKAALTEMEVEDCINTVGGFTEVTLLKAIGLFIGALILAKGALKIHANFVAEGAREYCQMINFMHECSLPGGYREQANRIYIQTRNDKKAAEAFYPGISETNPLRAYVARIPQEEKEMLFVEIKNANFRLQPFDESELTPALTRFCTSFEWKEYFHCNITALRTKERFLNKNKGNYRILGLFVGTIGSAAMLYTEREKG